jgi:hypothetical protein
MQVSEIVKERTAIMSSMRGSLEFTYAVGLDRVNVAANKSISVHCTLVMLTKHT